jgi:hypothetical protein
MKGTSERKYSRLAFFNVCLFVTASEGEELIVNIIGRHVGSNAGRISRRFWLVETAIRGEMVAQRVFLSEKTGAIRG